MHFQNKYFMNFEFVNKKWGYEYYDIVMQQYISKVLSEKLSIFFFEDKIINYMLGMSFASPY